MQIGVYARDSANVNSDRARATSDLRGEASRLPGHHVDVAGCVCLDGGWGGGVSAPIKLLGVQVPRST